MAGVTNGRCGGDFHHLTLMMVDLTDVADVQMASKDDMNPGLDETTTQLGGVINHIGGCQCVLHVEMGHQMMMHHGDDAPTR